MNDEEAKSALMKVFDKIDLKEVMQSAFESQEYEGVFMRIHRGPIPMKEYVGLTEEDAQRKAEEDGLWDFHVSSRDGNQYPMSASLSMNRLAVKIKEGIVTEASQG